MHLFSLSFRTPLGQHPSTLHRTEGPGGLKGQGPLISNKNTTLGIWAQNLDVLALNIHLLYLMLFFYKCNNANGRTVV